MLTSNFTVSLFILKYLNTSPGINPNSPDATVINGSQAPLGAIMQPNMSATAPTAKPVSGPRYMPAKKQGIYTKEIKLPPPPSGITNMFAMTARAVKTAV